MKALDFLFKICYAPFLNVEKGGRQAALIWLSPSLTFSFMGALIRFIYSLFGVRIFSSLSALAASIFSFIAFLTICFLLHKVYIKDERDVGKISYRFLFGLMMPVIFIGSIIFFIYSVKHFG